jgi:hypothetical protein
MSKLYIIVLALWLFWVLYVFTMAIYRAKLAGRLSRPALVLAFPFVLLAVLVDLVTQFTLASVVFREWPTIQLTVVYRIWGGRTWQIPTLTGDLMVTARLDRYREGPDGWRKELATAICTKLLDPFNATANPHCS